MRNGLVEMSNGTRLWYFSGQRLTFDEWLCYTNTSEKQKTMLRIQYDQTIL